MSEKPPTHGLIKGECRPKSPTLISLIAGTSNSSARGKSNIRLTPRRNLRSIQGAYLADKKEWESPKNLAEKGQKSKKA